METPIDLDLVKRCYLAYCKSVEFKNFQGDKIPEFDDLPLKIQQAWHNAVAVAYLAGVNSMVD